MRLLVLFCILAACVASAATERNAVPLHCRQCLVVTTDSWSATSGQLFAFARAKGGPWRRRGLAVPVLVGENGLAWGRGVLPQPALPGPQKVEGDHKAPAGVFALGPAFGYAAQAPATKMRYLALSHHIVGVDDPHSHFYNQLVDTSRTQTPDWHSAEKMILGDDRYKWGIVVKHNVPPKAGAGSCIFLHVWKDPATVTVGCTAMPEKALLDLIKWLDPAYRPLLIQLPASLYNELRSKRDFPDTGSDVSGRAY